LPRIYEEEKPVSKIGGGNSQKKTGFGFGKFTKVVDTVDHELNQIRYIDAKKGILVLEYFSIPSKTSSGLFKKTQKFVQFSLSQNSFLTDTTLVNAVVPNVLMAEVFLLNDSILCNNVELLTLVHKLGGSIENMTSAKK
jgi:hypothetical protein